MSWDQGRAVVDDLIARSALERVTPSREHADLLLAQAARHLATAEASAASDPEAAYAVAYDAARKALAAVLANQGLRSTTAGGHLAGYQAVRAQLDPPMGAVLRPFDQMRRQRHQVEYPRLDAPGLNPLDVLEALPKAAAIVEVAGKVVDVMPPY